MEAIVPPITEERVISVTVFTSGLTRIYDDASLSHRRQELMELVATAGGKVVAEVTQPLPKPQSATFIGKGKVEELSEILSEHSGDLVVFNHDLSPRQQRNLEDLLKITIIDRTRLILDIFAQRAKSKEGKLQVELAQLTYILPRLTGRGTDLSRLAGGIGTRGPGETKLETDRRRIRNRMTEVRREIDEIRSHRHLLRENRRRHSIPVFALVGYTNAGKSTLLNRLTNSEQLAEDKLFATLDPTIRRLELPHAIEARLIDTVGFVRDLPKQLIAAFKATLEEVEEADFLLHVIDASHENWPDQALSVTEILADMGVLQKDTITVFNKSDRFQRPPDPAQSSTLPNPVYVSALYGNGADELLQAMAEFVQRRRIEAAFEIPYSRMDILDELHQLSEVITEEYEAEGVQVRAKLTPAVAQQLRAKLVNSAVSVSEEDRE